MISVIVTVLLSVAADQLTKLAAVRLLKPGSVTALPGVLDFTYVENRGAAFGILADHRYFSSCRSRRSPPYLHIL